MIQQKIADMEVKIESARMLNYKAACLKDNKQVFTKYCLRIIQINILTNKLQINIFSVLH